MSELEKLLDWAKRNNKIKWDLENFDETDCIRVDGVQAAEEYAALKARAENAEAILQRLEFIETDEGDKECPSCRFVEPSHAEDCELYAALKAGAK